jgi:GcrA cell cycle regulator
VALNEEQLEIVKTRWTVDGDSAGQIAGGLGVTRNVVIGVIHRRGWVQAGGEPGRPRPRLPVIHHREPRPPKPETPAKAARTALVVDDPEQHVALDQLGPHHCRYPVGEAGKYCGQRPNGSPYCDGHARIVYQPQQPGRIKRPR